MSGARFPGVGYYSCITSSAQVFGVLGCGPFLPIPIFDETDVGPTFAVYTMLGVVVVFF